jgi:hypothetical protein
MAEPAVAPSREPTLICEMMQRLGIEPGGGVLPDLGLRYLRAFRRCEQCISKRACRAWLDDRSSSAAHAPHFCANADALFELQINSSVPHFASGHTASGRWFAAAPTIR